MLIYYDSTTEIGISTEKHGSVEEAIRAGRYATCCSTGEAPFRFGWSYDCSDTQYEMNKIELGDISAWDSGIWCNVTTPYGNICWTVITL